MTADVAESLVRLRYPTARLTTRHYPKSRTRRYAVRVVVGGRTVLTSRGRRTAGAAWVAAELATDPRAGGGVT